MADVITCDELWKFLYAKSSVYVFARAPFDTVTGRLDTANKFVIAFPSDAFEDIFNMAVFLHAWPGRRCFWDVFSPDAQQLLSEFFSAEAALGLVSDTSGFY